MAGCASLFGDLYEIGPKAVTSDLVLEPRRGAWNRIFGLLFIDQPIGTGFSVSGQHRIPMEEMGIASDLYIGLQSFYAKHAYLAARPLIIAGESYAGKYVPSIGHFILQVSNLLGGSQGKVSQLEQARPIPPEALQAGPPKFHLAGLAIGDGLTHPELQVLVHADAAHYAGIIDIKQQTKAMQIQLTIVQLIDAGLWPAAHGRRQVLLDYITRSGGLATLMDYRRTNDYDSDKLVDQYLNQLEVKEALGAAKHIRFESCSDHIGAILGPDVMKSVLYLLPDVLRSVPLLLYQGQFDLLDGPPACERWLGELIWTGAAAFAAAPRHVWRVQESAAFQQASWEPGQHPGDLRFDDPCCQAEAAGAGLNCSQQQQQMALDGHQHLTSGCHASPSLLQSTHGPVAGYWKRAGPLNHVILKNSGHMVPQDQPGNALAMIETWGLDALEWQASQNMVAS
ncbi:hypothetical protein WJX84_011664 [Apatococcus fuscideae]|uniref:Carboxypeptidase n=1 Tax=Apatococcus fuscideae TaxID=2026836 RepID=A0AAW1T5F9_9CHLO